MDDIWPDIVNSKPKLEGAYCPKCKKNRNVFLYFHRQDVNVDYFIEDICKYDDHKNNFQDDKCYLSADSGISTKDDVTICVMTYRRKHKNGQ